MKDFLQMKERGEKITALTALTQLRLDDSTSSEEATWLVSRWLHHALPTRLQHEFHVPVTDVVVKDV